MEEKQAHSHGKDIASLRIDLQSRDPFRLAENSGARFVEKDSAFFISYWNEQLIIGFPDFSVLHADTREHVDEGVETVLIHYMHTADGVEKGDNWVSLADLPDGSFYRHAYQGYSGNYLVSIVRNDQDSLEQACRTFGGNPEGYGDLSFSFHVLPRIDLLLVYHRGDDEFDPSAQVLFSSSASHFLPTDLFAYLGRQLVLAVLDARG